VRLKDAGRVKNFEPAGHTGKAWLLLKKRDRFATKTRDLIATERRSILSALTIEELADAPRITETMEKRAAELGASEHRVCGRDIPPMLCEAGGSQGAAPGWIYEVKLGGVRMLATKEGEDVTLHYRKSRDATDTYPEVARAVRALAAPSAVLDGE